MFSKHWCQLDASEKSEACVLEIGAEFIRRWRPFTRGMIMHGSWVRWALAGLRAFPTRACGSARARTNVQHLSEGYALHSAPRLFVTGITDGVTLTAFTWWASVLQYDSWALLWTVGILYFITLYYLSSYSVENTYLSRSVSWLQHV